VTIDIGTTFTGVMLLGEVDELRRTDRLLTKRES
jgi:hypothetical protein